MQTLGRASGPVRADLLLVGEAFGAEEARAGVPFVGNSGWELKKMFGEAGLVVGHCRLTNVVNARPPKNQISEFFASSKRAASALGITKSLYDKYPKPIVLQGLEELAGEIRRAQPKLILALGNTALWALTGESGITKWRGSLLEVTDSPVGALLGPNDPHPKVIPTYHPAAIFRQWSWRHIAVSDMIYARNYLHNPVSIPQYRFLVRPTKDQVLHTIQVLLQEPPSHISCDVETRGGHIACLGVGWSRTDSLCVPFLDKKGSYWESPEDEAEVVLALRRLLTSRDMNVVWQNGLYDIQYFYRDWAYFPNVAGDTMLMQHAVFPMEPKGLDFLASRYCQYRRYWKDEGKEWHTKVQEDELWEYNCKDCVVTWEAYLSLKLTLQHYKCWHVYEHSMSLYEPVLFMMLNGIGIDVGSRDGMKLSLDMTAEGIQHWLNKVFGEKVNVSSPKQLQKIFYDEMNLPVVTNRKTGRPTLNAEALNKLAIKEPLIAPITARIETLRSINVFRKTFLSAAVDRDGRMRCSYNIGGTTTGRFSSSTNAFGSGTNLENIPRSEETPTTPIVKLPNIRSLFVPDPGCVIADFDLDRADAHIVAWEADDPVLKELFHNGVDIHSRNAEIIGSTRQIAKSFVHGTNYGGGPRTISATLGLPLNAVKEGQARWFEAHPNIREWHNRVFNDLQAKHYITTVFGRVIYFFDRIDRSRLNEALAHLGQSPVADVINKGLRRVYAELPWAILLLQNHDSVVVQLPKDCLAERLFDIKRCLEIEVPFEDPLIIPVGCKVGEDSWGALREWDFERGDYA